MNNFITTLLQAVITAAVPVLTTYAVRWLGAVAARAREQAKTEEADRYLSEASNAIQAAVLKTSQTYVDALKKSGEFTVENQREAFNMAFAEAKSMLNDNAARFIESAYGDVTNYLTAQIEAKVRALK